jgi:predicted ABC-type ATPase
LAGPNGAGKTSFANRFLLDNFDRLVFVNADEIARSMQSSTLNAGALDIAAGRALLSRVRALVAARSNFMVETTLATNTYVRLIPKWREKRYRISLIYLYLPSAQASLDRVQQRVAAGGHSIPADTVKRRYQRSLENLSNRYKSIVDDWSVWESLDGDFRLMEVSVTA